MQPNCFTTCHRLLAVVTPPSNSLMDCLETVFAPLPILILLIFNGFKRVCPLKTAALESVVCHRLHLQPFCSQLQKGTRDIQDLILFQCDATNAIDSAVDLVMAQWTSSQCQSRASPTGPSTKQHEFDKPFIAVDKASLMLSIPKRHDHVRLLAVSAPHSGNWLHTLPI